jgi:hypothetical protein
MRWLQGGHWVIGEGNRWVNEVQIDPINFDHALPSLRRDLGFAVDMI